MREKHDPPREDSGFGFLAGFAVLLLAWAIFNNFPRIIAIFERCTP